jgi:phosphoglycerate kinase
LLEEDRLDTVLNIYKKAKDKGVNLHLPEDSIVANAFDASALVQSSTTKDIPANWMGLDIGPKAIEEFRRVILQSHTILWNGPMGVFEWKSFENGTKNIALAVAEATKSGAYSLIGGGDSAAAIAKFNLSSQVSYVSTGGGALLELFEGKTLPGVKALS